MGEGTDKFGLMKIFVRSSKGCLTCQREIFHLGADGFTYPPKEGLLRIFLALKNPPPSARTGLVILGSSGKQGRRYTTEDDLTNDLKLH